MWTEPDSSRDGIRFWINYSQYVKAKRGPNGDFEVLYGEIKEETVERLNKKDSIKIFCSSFSKKFLIFFFSILIFSRIITLKNFLAFFLMFNLLWFLFNVANALKSAYKIPFLQKRKHAAEHMMVNFLEKENRLPKNIEEVKKSSRFCKNCGCRKETKNVTDIFVRNVCVFGIGWAYGTIPQITKVSLEEMPIVLYIAQICLALSVWIILEEKYHLLDFIINPIQEVLTLMLQCCNTTKMVQDEDVTIAYLAAGVWVKIVYPEFYEKEN